MLSTISSKEKLLNKYDIMYIIFIGTASLLLILYGIYFLTDKGERGIIKYDNREIMAFDLNENRIIVLRKKDYPLLLGDMTIEVKDGKIAVIKETSPHNYCSLEGFTNESKRPIICQPNKVVILIEGRQDDTDGGDIDMEVR